MGVTYKLKDEVVEFIVSQKRADPSSSCRQLAEVASEKFGLKLSKSSVHDVLKESGIVTPRGRKPKNKFEIPEQKKKQIQVSLSQVKLIVPPQEPEVKLIDLPSGQPSIEQKPESIIKSEEVITLPVIELPILPQNEEEFEISAEYEQAGKIFYKAAQWDLGIYAVGNIKESDWDYYLTYSKGVKIHLSNNQELFVEMSVPIERCVREVVDGLVNNINPFIASKISDLDLFKQCMNGENGNKINSIEIVGNEYRILAEFDNIVDVKRSFLIENRDYVESYKRSFLERLKEIFFSQEVNLNVINEMLNIKGMDKVNKQENVVNLIIDDTYEHKALLEKAARKLNNMFLRDDQDRLVRVEI